MDRNLTNTIDLQTKKVYQKPQLIKVKLTPNEAVLGPCKIGDTRLGPLVVGCNYPTTCLDSIS